MAHRYYDLTLDTAFEQAIGEHGASPLRFEHWLDQLEPVIPRIKAQPQREAGPVLDLPSRTDDLAEIESIAAYIASHFKTLIVAGMGGSSLSGETLASLRRTHELTLRFLDNVDPVTIDHLVQTTDWQHTAIMVISKSGNTVESLAQMAVLLRESKARVKDYAKHFFVVTIADGNPLHTLAKEHGMRVIPHDPKLGGRFSILSCVGLIPAAAIGLDVRALRAGAQAVLEQHFSPNGQMAPAAQSAALHMALMEKSTRVNVIMHYGDRLGGLASWYRQCWGESLGKCDMATTPVRSRGTTDQHSQLQLYLDGPKDKFFSLMMLSSTGQGQSIEHTSSSDPRLNFLKGRTLGDLMVAEQRATFSTLIKRGCPVRSFMMNELNEAVLGALLMHFSLEVMFTAELLGVNAFDQPAVEDSKIFALQYLAGDDQKAPAVKKIG